MKKILSFILATAIILSLIPAAFATTESEGFTIRYKISEELREEYMDDKNSGNKLIEKLTKGETNGFFEFDSVPEGEVLTDNTCIRLRYYGSDPNYVTSIQVQKNKSVSFNVYVPVSATYKMKMTHTTHKTVSTDITVTVEDKSFGTYNCLNADNASFAVYAVSDLPQAVYLSKGWHKITFASNNTAGSIGSFSLISGDGTGNALMPYFNGNTTLEIGETATFTGYLSSTVANADVTYTTNNDCVTVGEDGTITAVKPGKATVTMTASDASVVAANPYTVEITVPGVKTAFVSIGVDDDGDGVATITNAALGEEVTVTATDRENMVFRGWVRGSADNGHLVWDKPEYTFTATTHTYLTAIYSEKVEGEANEYYHWNGQFLGNDKTTAEANISPIVGYTFAKSWTEAKKENSITSWIANFTKNNGEYEVNGNGFTMTMDDSKYDTEVTCTSDNGAVYWYRDGELVDYGKEYKFFIWDDTTVTTSDKGHNGAKLMLDKKKDNTYMVEYDAGDAKLLEAGILFGDTGENPTVESCKEKMSSQRNINEKGHGQFSATSEYAVARGYLVYQDGSTYRVIYAD